jgi:putative DNA primase/helicase
MSAAAKQILDAFGAADSPGGGGNLDAALEATGAGSCLETALLALDLGLSPVPPREDGTKAPIADIRRADGSWTWKQYRTTPATRQHVEGWYRSGLTGVGLVGGHGNLEPFDFDSPETFKDFLEAAWVLGHNELVTRIRSGYEETTPGGVHWLYRCPDVKGSTILAQRPAPTPEAPEGKKTLIETRTSGFIIVAPSNGKVHPTGRSYRLSSGGLTSILTITPDERDALHALARTFDEMPDKREPAPSAWGDVAVTEAGTRPGDDFASKTSWESILEPHGWVKVHTRGEVIYWRRPGKDHGWSATTGFCSGFKVFSTSTPFSTQGTHSKLHAYAVLNHQGDMPAAAKALAAQGYGNRQSPASATAKNTNVKLAPDDPHRLGRLFLKKHCRHEGRRTLVYHRGEFHVWEGSAYRPFPDHEVNGHTGNVSRNEFDRLNKLAIELWEKRGRTDEKGKPCGPPLARKVGTRLIGDIAQALRGETILPETIEPPAWLIDNPPFPEADVLPTSNALVHLPSWVGGKAAAIHKPTPSFFCPYALDYGFNPKAPEPTAWLDFLDSVWPHDGESQLCLQEWAGYLLTLDTRQQKIGVFIGPPRSGRGTISRVFSGLIGAQNVANPSLAGLGSLFGASSLIGRPLAVVADARQSNRSDWALALERLLNISGEDSMTIPRKNKPDWTGRLPTRLMLISNELPRFPDHSGALAARFLLFRFTESFLGKEDKTLDARLQAELPSILLWAIEGWKRFRNRGGFLQPSSGQALIDQMRDLSSPVGAFVRERCEVGAGFMIPRKDLFSAWKDWCVDRNREEGSEETFGRNLVAVIPWLGMTQPRDEQGKRFRAYEGIRLQPGCIP